MCATASSLAGHHMHTSRRTGFFIDEGRLQGGGDQMFKCSAGGLQSTWKQSTQLCRAQSLWCNGVRVPGLPVSEESFGGAEPQGGVDSFGVGKAFQEGFDLDTLERVWEINKKKSPALSSSEPVSAAGWEWKGQGCQGAWGCRSGWSRALGRALGLGLLLQPCRGGGTGGVGRADAGDRGKAVSLPAAWLERVPTCLP